MSAAPDPAELAPSRDPAVYGRRPRVTSAVAAWVIACIACVFAGITIGRWGVQVAPAPAPQPAPAAPSRPAPDQSPVVPALTQPPPAAAPAGLSDRVTRLESAQGRTDQAAAAALAAATLSEAAQGSGPFAADLVPFQRLMPASSDLSALAPLAARGAPSRAALAAALPQIASIASAAAHRPKKPSGYLSLIGAWISRVVIIRRVDPNAPGVDGVLVRAETQAGAGDLAGAVSTLDRLSPEARAPLAEWVAAAQRRIEIDRLIAALRAQALAGLAQDRAS
jgi:hypothetical protein